MTEPTMTSRDLMLRWLEDNIDHGEGGASPEEVMQTIEASSWLAELDTKSKTEALTEAASSDLVHLMQNWSAEQRHQNPDFILGYETAIKDANWLVRRVLTVMANR